MAKVLALWHCTDMIKDGGDLVKECLLWLFNCILASHFLERLSFGLSTAVYKSGNKFDMSNSEISQLVL